MQFLVMLKTALIWYTIRRQNRLQQRAGRQKGNREQEKLRLAGRKEVKALGRGGSYDGRERSTEAGRRSSGGVG